MLKPDPRRNAFQKEQRHRTRRSICQAALSVFAETGYAGASIEPILSRAGVSRAAFYSHFDSKVAVVCAIGEDFEPAWRPIFGDLAAMDDPGLADLAVWAERFLHMHRSNVETCSLLTQVAAIEERLYRLVARQRDDLIEMLGAHLPAFAAARLGETALLEARILLWQIDQVCFRVVRQDFRDCENAVPHVIASQMLHFLQHPKRAPSRIPAAGLRS